MEIGSFGTSSVGDVHRLVIGTEPGPVLEVLDLGATVHRLWVTGGDGVRRNVVLGHATPEEYLLSRDFIGGTVGRFANRIDGAQFELDGEVVHLLPNEGDTALHGGPDGFHHRLWQVLGHDDDHVELELVSPDGDQGYPGEVRARAVFSVRADAVQVDLSATTSAPTVVSLTSHAYFNLDGDGAGSVADQLLSVVATDYLPVDGRGIPGARTPVAGSRFDLRRPVRLADAGDLDHCFLLDGTGLRDAASLSSPSTRTRVEVATDSPGLQVYSGIGLDGSRRSTTGHRYQRGEGLALEAQLPPDTPNRPDLGSAVLRPGETWRSRTEWRFMSD